MAASILPAIKRRLSGRWAGPLLGAVASTALGLALVLSPAGGALTRLSFDFPFLLKKAAPPNDVVVVYMDELSHKELEQPTNLPWDRKVHARLIDRLRTEHARAIVFDMVADAPSPVAGVDEVFARAIKAHGNVFLGADYVPRETAGGATVSTLDLPTAVLREAEAGWGVVQFSVDGDGAIRSMFQSRPELPTLAWSVARALSGQTNTPPPPVNCWINYYGPPDLIPHISYAQALEENGAAAGFFRDKIVFVGARQSTGFTGSGKDEYGTAYTSWTGRFAPGTEIHATCFLNLFHQNWLKRLPQFLELALVVLAGIGFGGGVTCLRPMAAALASAGGMIGCTLGALLFFRLGHLWFAWLILVVQIVAAFSWSILVNSLQSYVERRLLTQSLALHVSPSRVEQLLRNPELRKPGGEQQQVSILFSDIANFSKITGKMDIEDLFALLNRYFETSLTCIHQTDGTVVKLIGDAIFAIWNAPAPQEDHRERTCRTALLLRDQLVQFDQAQRGLPLRTRVGLHTGQACVGNVGSQQRFDYTAIGDSINLASRLEGFNKQVGTDVLATRDILKGLEDKLVSRLVGHFRFKGFDRVVEVHELISTSEQAAASKDWRESFAEALYHFQRKSFDAAVAGFKKTQELHPGDGPSQFYLDQISHLDGQTLHPDWTGEIDLKEK